jgi:hypothetical protein
MFGQYQRRNRRLVIGRKARSNKPGHAKRQIRSGLTFAWERCSEAPLLLAFHRARWRRRENCMTTMYPPKRSKCRESRRTDSVVIYKPKASPARVNIYWVEETFISSTDTHPSHQQAHISILTTNIYKMTTLTFDPTTFIPPLANKIIFITGGTAGLGRETILSLATHNPAHIYFLGRSQASADQLIAEVREAQKDAAQQVPLTFIRIDLVSMASIKAGAADFLSRETRLDLFFANAGVMALPPGLTEDGYEVQFGTNHLGHAALVKLLLPTMERTAAGGEGGCDVRIIWNTSQGYKFASGIDFSGLLLRRGRRWLVGGTMSL